MTLKEILDAVKDCDCGRVHACDLEGVEVGSGIINEVANILKKYNFPKRLLLVADENSFRETKGLYEQLLDAGFTTELRVYESMRVADMREVRELEACLDRVDALISVGTGSINDICRYSSYRANKQLAIIATAPSMDGFASDSAPITENNFKVSYQCRQPRVIIADTKIMAKSPVELKAAGFGDVMAKYIGLADWRVANLLTGEYYCERVASLVRKALGDMIKLADQVPQNSEEAVKAIVETLILTGVAMQLAKCTRPASGTEHIISHFWECKKLVDGKISDYHGKKVGVATLICADIYHKLAKIEKVKAHREVLDWDAIEKAYGAELMPEVRKYHTPDSIVNDIDPALIEEKWSEICQIIREEIPTAETLEKYYDLAHCAKTGKDIAVSDELFDLGIKFHPYMRRRVTIIRLLPMLDIDALAVYKSDKK